MRIRRPRIGGLAALLGVACGVEEGRSAGSCSDGADNDGNGLFDCLDPGCEDSPHCGTERTDSGVHASDPDTGDGVVSDDLWCPVAEMIATICEDCHSDESPSELHLDLETDPWSTLVGQPSIQWPEEHTLVVAGDPEGSLFYRKISGTQASDEGDSMPPVGGVEEGTLRAVYDWILGGANHSDCE